MSSSAALASFAGSEFIDPRTGINWAVAGNYHGFVMSVRKAIRKRTLASMVGPDLTLAEIKGHEDPRFWRFEETVPVIARKLDLDPVALRALFEISRNTSGWVWRKHRAKYDPHPPINEYGLTKKQIAAAHAARDAWLSAQAATEVMRSLKANVNNYS